MTSADAAHRKSSALARGWRNFRRWRRGRPFWGGLFTLLSGLQIYASTQLSIGEIEIRVGLTGFLSYVIPLVLALCGVLIWLTPQQRVFYGVIAAVVAVYSFIGVNFGGFFIGMLLGIIGGALAVAWTPVKHEEPEAQVDEPEEPGADSTRAAPDEEYQLSSADTSMDELLTGPLTDVLPRPVNPLTEPVHSEHRPDEEGEERRDDEATQPLPSQWPEEQRPVDRWPEEQWPEEQRPEEPAPDRGNGTEGPLPRRTPRLFVITLIPMLLAMAFIGEVHGTSLARAAPAPYPSPCPAPTSSSSVKASPSPGAGASSSAKAPATGANTGAPGPSPSPSPSPASPSPASPAAGSPSAGSTSAGSTQDSGTIGGIIGGVGDAVGDVWGSAETAPSPSATPSSTPTRTPGAAGPTGAGQSTVAADATTSAQPEQSASGTPTPTASADCVVVNAKQLAADGDPVVQKVPDRMTGSKLTLDGFTFDGVTALATADGGTIRVLQFSMDKAVTDDFELRVPGPLGRTISLKSSALTVQKTAQKVKFFCSRFQGNLNLLGVEIPIPLTFTPDFPPPLTLPHMVFTDIDIQLVFVDTDQLLAPDLDTNLVS